jgi:hypothetical protein
MRRVSMPNFEALLRLWDIVNPCRYLDGNVNFVTQPLWRGKESTCAMNEQVSGATLSRTSNHELERVN